MTAIKQQNKRNVRGIICPPRWLNTISDVYRQHQPMTALYQLAEPPRRFSRHWWNDLNQQIDATQPLSSIELFVSPRRRIKAILPGVEFNGLPISARLVQQLNDAVAQVNAGFGKVARGGVALLAQWDQPYLSWAGKLAKAFKNAGFDPVYHWSANRFNGGDVLTNLEKFKPEVVIYCGHGDDDGLCAYHGINANELAFLAQTGCQRLWLAIACDTLNHNGSGTPFGVQMVRQGSCQTFIGAYSSVLTKHNQLLVNEILEALSVRGRLHPNAVKNRNLREFNNALRKALLAEGTHYRCVGRPLMT